MNRSEFEVLETLTKPGKYLAQYKSLAITCINYPHDVKVIRTFDGLKIGYQYYPIQAIATCDIYLLPVRITLERYISNVILK